MHGRVRGRLIVVVPLLGAIALAWAFSRPERPQLSIEVTGYTFYKTGPLANIRVTNVGPTPVRWSDFGFDSGQLQVKNGNDWETQRELGTHNWLHPHRLLQPGQTCELGFGIHGNPSQWRLRYKIQTASLKERTSLRLKGEWRKRLQWICDRVLPDNPGPQSEMTSDIFDGSNFVQAHELEQPAVLDFNPLSGLLK